MKFLSTPAGGSAFLQELEVEVCTELTLAETGLAIGTAAEPTIKMESARADICHRKMGKLNIVHDKS